MKCIELLLQAGGPVYNIPKGRKDGRRSKIEDTINLPFPTFNASELIRQFGQHGFSVQEMVALSGNHILLPSFSKYNISYTKSQIDIIIYGDNWHYFTSLFELVYDFI